MFYFHLDQNEVGEKTLNADTIQQTSSLPISNDEPDVIVTVPQAVAREYLYHNSIPTAVLCTTHIANQEELLIFSDTGH